MKKKHIQPLKCPCHSGYSYRECCFPLHQGAPAANAKSLMRSRYSAYSMGNIEYIIKTTCPDEPAFNPDTEQWRIEISAFSRSTKFIGLEINEFVEAGDIAYVTFVADLWQSGSATKLVERSRFLKRQDRWLYARGDAGAV